MATGNRISRRVARGGLKINRRQGEKVFFFLGTRCIGQIICDTPAELSALFSKDVLVKREENLNSQERLAANV